MGAERLLLYSISSAVELNTVPADYPSYEQHYAYVRLPYHSILCKRGSLVHACEAKAEAVMLINEISVVRHSTVRALGRGIT
jgi:hypothetical protein